MSTQLNPKLCEFAKFIMDSLDEKTGEAGQVAQSQQHPEAGEAFMRTWLVGVLGDLIDEVASERRAEFAAMAMQGLLSSRNGFMVDIGTETVGVYAVQCADALLAELAKPVSEGVTNG